MAKRPKQSLIPGSEPERIKALDDAAEIYYDAVQERLPYTQAESEAKDNLIAKTIEHGTSLYENDDFKVILTDTHNVKCKKRKASENGEAE
jgi:tyrosine-protein phosphatase YwqE